MRNILIHDMWKLMKISGKRHHLSIHRLRELQQCHHSGHNCVTYLTQVHHLRKTYYQMGI